MLHNSQIRVARVPRFTGHAEPPAKGHAAKKDIPMLFSVVSFLGGSKFQVHGSQFPDKIGISWLRFIPYIWEMYDLIYGYYSSTSVHATHLLHYHSFFLLT